MKDLTVLLNASIIPLMTLMAFAGVVFMISTGQDVDMILVSVVGAGLSKMGIQFGALPIVRKIRKK